jgi:hypothetical protein
MLAAVADFLETATRLGFVPAQDRPQGGVRTYTAPANRFLTHWLHVYEDGTALLTWEFAVADYLLERGIQLGSSESLNLFMFPAEDQRGPQDPAWLTHALDQVEARLRSVNFADPESQR